MKTIRYLVLVLVFSGCKKKDQFVSTTCDPQISYAATVRPVFVANCTGSGCHDGISYPSLAEYVVARDASSQIRDAVVRGLMPKNGHLSNTDKNAIVCWIDSGSRNN